MDNTTLIFVSILAFCVNLWIMHAIIKSATKSTRNILLQEAQVKLLASIALKIGVPLDDINKDTKGIELNEPPNE